MPTLTITLTLDQILSLPGDAVVFLLRQGQADTATLQAALESEYKGKGRWPVTNGIRKLLTPQTP